MGIVGDQVKSGKDTPHLLLQNLNNVALQGRLA